MIQSGIVNEFSLNPQVLTDVVELLCSMIPTPVLFSSSWRASRSKVIAPPAPFPRKLPQMHLFRFDVISVKPFVGFVIHVILIIKVASSVHLS